MLSSGTLRSGWRRGAVLCLLLWTTSAPAVGTKTATSDTAGAEAALAKMRDAKNECNTKRKEQEAAFMKVIQPNALHGGLTFDQLKDPKNVQNLATVKCRYAAPSEHDQNHHQACAKTYNEGVQYMLSSDKTTGEACDMLQTIGDESAKCDLGAAACLRKFAGQLRPVTVKLNKAYEASGKAVKKFQDFFAWNKKAAQEYVDRLGDIAKVLKEYEAAGKTPSFADPELQRKLGTNEIEHQKLPIYAALIGLNEETFSSRGVELKRAEFKALLTAPAGSQTSADVELNPIFQQYNSAQASHELAAFTAQRETIFGDVGHRLDTTANSFDRIAESYSPPPVTAPSPAAQTNPKIASVAPEQTEKGADLSSGTGASRAISGFSRGGGGTAPPGQAGSRPLTTIRSESGASSGATPTEVSPYPGAASFGSDGLSYAIQGNKEPAAQAQPVNAESPGSAATNAIHTDYIVPGQAGDSPWPRASSDLSIARAGARANEGTLGAFETELTPTPPKSVAGPGSAASAPPTPEALRFADSEIMKLEKFHPMTSDLRAMLRARMANDFTKKASAAGAAQSKGDGVSAAENLFRDLHRDGWQANPDSPEFRMMADDTDAAVRRLMGDENSENEQLRSVSLFSRVHAAHERSWKSRLAPHL